MVELSAGPNGYPADALIEDLKVVQATKRDLEAATEKAKAAREALVAAEKELSDAMNEHTDAINRLEANA